MNIIHPQRSQKSAMNNRRVKKNQPRGAVFNTYTVQKGSEHSSQSSVGFFKRINDRVIGIKHSMNKGKIFIPELFILIAFVGFSGWALSNVKAEKPIESVVVKGEFKQIDKSSLEATLSPLVGTNYFSVDIAKIKNSLLDFAWVQSAQVRKIWPAQLEISIIENQAVALWGKEAFVNELGDIFRPNKINYIHLADLPDLNGLDKDSDSILKKYIKLSEITAKHDFSITHFSLISDNFWTIKLSNDIELCLDKGNEAASLEVFFTAYKEHFIDSERNIASIDMRYGNGFSIRFQEDENVNTELVRNHSNEAISDEKQISDEEKHPQSELTSGKGLSFKRNTKVRSHHG